jgi:hypothetical protein
VLLCNHFQQGTISSTTPLSIKQLCNRNLFNKDDIYNNLLSSLYAAVLTIKHVNNYDSLSKSQKEWVNGHMLKLENDHQIKLSLHNVSINC